MTRYELIAQMAAQICSGLLAGDSETPDAGFESRDKMCSYAVRAATTILRQIDEFQPAEFGSES